MIEEEGGKAAMWISDFINGESREHMKNLPALDKCFAPFDLRQEAVHTWNKKGKAYTTTGHITDISKSLANTCCRKRYCIACSGNFSQPSPDASYWSSSDMHSRY